MDTLLQFLDRWTEKIPPGGMKLIRYSALFLWLGCALVVVTYSFTEGAKSAPQSGQDLSRATIQERITKEANLKNPPTMDLELTEQEMPFRRPRKSGLSGEETTLPPFLGEDVDQDPYLPYLPDRTSLEVFPIPEAETEKEDKLQLLPVSEPEPSP